MTPARVARARNTSIAVVCRMIVLGYHISEKGAVNSDKEEPKHLSLVEFLLQPKNGTIRVLYDLDYSVGLVIKSLKLTLRETATLCDTTKFHLPPYHLRYVTGKFISIKRANAFSYFSNASQYVKYPNEDLVLNNLLLAERAKATGELVVSILGELGIESTSLTSPARAYERTQVEYLYKEMQKSTNNATRRGIIDSIGIEVFGRSWEKYLEGR